MSELSIRDRERADLERLVPVLAEVHRLDRYPLNWPHDPIRWLFPHNTAHAWVAETAGGAVVGHVAVHRLPSTTDSTLLATVEASRLFVAPGARGHGLGAELLGHARLWAAEHRCSLTLDIVDDQRSAAAIALYERTGWKHDRTCTATWTTPHGSPVRLRRYVAPGEGPTVPAADR